MSGSSGRGAARQKKCRVLFVCIGNSCRSQMAEALARHKYPDLIEPSSAGVAAAGEIAWSAREVLAERGVSCGHQSSKQLTREDCSRADLIVNMTRRPWESAVYFDAAQVEDWDVVDPGADLELARLICDEIEARLDNLAARLRKELARKGGR